MCELFAMSSRLPTTVGFSLDILARHGGLEGPHKDGWGVGYYQGNDVSVLRETKAAAESPLVKFIEQHGPPSQLVVSHIRMATQGKPALSNTQPFVRELAGRQHLFAHNGDLDGIEQMTEFRPNRFQPIGETDSEIAFCHLMDSMAPMWEKSQKKPPSLESRLEIFTEFTAKLRPLGPANLLYADADVLFVHSHRRTQPDGENKPPGLYLLQRRCKRDQDQIPPKESTQSPQQQQIVLIASVPLTEEPWEPMVLGEIVVLSAGEIVNRQPIT